MKSIPRIIFEHDKHQLIFFNGTAYVFRKQSDHVINAESIGYEQEKTGQNIAQNAPYRKKAYCHQTQDAWQKDPEVLNVDAPDQ